MRDMFLNNFVTFFIHLFFFFSIFSLKKKYLGRTKRLNKVEKLNHLVYSSIRGCQGYFTLYQQYSKPEDEHNLNRVACTGSNYWLNWLKLQVEPTMFEHSKSLNSASGNMETKPKELSFCQKLKFSNPYICATWWCKPSLIFQT